MQPERLEGACLARRPTRTRARCRARVPGTPRGSRPEAVPAGALPFGGFPSPTAAPRHRGRFLLAVACSGALVTCCQVARAWFLCKLDLEALLRRRVRCHLLPLPAEGARSSLGLMVRQDRGTHAAHTGQGVALTEVTALRRLAVPRGPTCLPPPSPLAEARVLVVGLSSVARSATEAADRARARSLAVDRSAVPGPTHEWVVALPGTCRCAPTPKSLLAPALQPSLPLLAKSVGARLPPLRRSLGPFRTLALPPGCVVFRVPCRSPCLQSGLGSRPFRAKSTEVLSVRADRAFTEVNTRIDLCFAVRMLRGRSGGGAVRSRAVATCRWLAARCLRIPEVAEASTRRLSPRGPSSRLPRSRAAAPRLEHRSWLRFRGTEAEAVCVCRRAGKRDLSSEPVWYRRTPSSVSSGGPVDPWTGRAWAEHPVCPKTPDLCETCRL